MKGTTRYNFTTIRADRSRRKKDSEALESRVERWLNNKVAEGWSLRDVFIVDEFTAHVLMLRKGD